MWTFRLSLLTVFATFVLLLAGGLVHATDSGLACPDWPTCYGSFMPDMVGGVLYEHSHRLIATAVGLLTIALAICVHRTRRDDRVAVRMGWSALALVIVQGVLGGVTVIFQLPTAVSTTHLAAAMAFFCLVITLAFRLRPGRTDVPERPPSTALVGVTAVAVYLQVVLGALVRHTDTGLACTDLPLCKGTLWLFGADPLLQIHMAHRLGALVVTALVVATSVRVLRSSPASSLVRGLAVLAPALVVVQLGLGLLSIHTALEVVTVTAHLGMGALLLASVVSLRLASAIPVEATP